MGRSQRTRPRWRWPPFEEPFAAAAHWAIGAPLLLRQFRWRLRHSRRRRHRVRRPRSRTRSSRHRPCRDGERCAPRTNHRELAIEIQRSMGPRCSGHRFEDPAAGSSGPSQSDQQPRNRGGRRKAATRRYTEVRLRDRTSAGGEKEGLGKGGRGTEAREAGAEGGVRRREEPRAPQRNGDADKASFNPSSSVIFYQQDGEGSRHSFQRSPRGSPLRPRDGLRRTGLTCFPDGGRGQVGLEQLGSIGEFIRSTREAKEADAPIGDLADAIPTNAVHLWRRHATVSSRPEGPSPTPWMERVLPTITRIAQRS